MFSEAFFFFLLRTKTSILEEEKRCGLVDFKGLKSKMSYSHLTRIKAWRGARRVCLSDFAESTSHSFQFAALRHTVTSPAEPFPDTAACSNYAGMCGETPHAAFSSSSSPAVRPAGCSRRALKRELLWMSVIKTWGCWCLFQA